MCDSDTDSYYDSDSDCDETDTTSIVIGIIFWILFYGAIYWCYRRKIRRAVEQKEQEMAEVQVVTAGNTAQTPSAGVKPSLSMVNSMSSEQLALDADLTRILHDGSIEAGDAPSFSLIKWDKDSFSKKTSSKQLEVDLEELAKKIRDAVCAFHGISNPANLVQGFKISYNSNKSDENKKQKYKQLFGREFLYLECEQDIHSSSTKFGPMGSSKMNIELQYEFCIMVALNGAAAQKLQTLGAMHPDTDMRPEIDRIQRRGTVTAQ